MIVKTANRVQHVKEYYFSRKLKEIAGMRKAGKDVINLGIGSPDLPPAPSVIERLRTESQNPTQHAYQSYSGHPELRKAFAGWYEKFFSVTLNPDNEVLPLIGSKEGIMHIAMTFLEAGDEVLIPNPGYPAYSATSLLAGATPVNYLLDAKNNWLPDLKALEEKDLTKVKMMWINYPHMPTGTLATKSFFAEIIAFAKRNEILIVNDNPYSFILNKNYLSLLSVEGAKDVAIELNSLSKSHNMAGWRIGMLAAAPDYIQAILKFKSNMDSGMFLPAQLAATEALNLPESWYENLNEHYRKRKEKACKIMDALSCVYEKEGAGLFVWAKIPDKWEDCYEIVEDLLQKAHVFITPGGIFGSQGARYIRISLCSKPEQLDEALQRIERCFLETKENNLITPGIEIK